jgi:hypothetical protein
MMTIFVGRSEHLCVDSTLMCTNKILLRDSPKTKNVTPQTLAHMLVFIVKHDVPFYSSSSSRFTLLYSCL